MDILRVNQRATDSVHIGDKLHIMTENIALMSHQGAATPKNTFSAAVTELKLTDLKQFN